MLQRRMKKKAVPFIGLLEEHGQKSVLGKQYRQFFGGIFSDVLRIVDDFINRNIDQE